MTSNSFVKDHSVDDERGRIRSTRILDLQGRCIPFVAALPRRRQGRQRTRQPSERTTMQRERLLRLIDEALATTSAIGNRDGGNSSQANPRV